MTDLQPPHVADLQPAPGVQPIPVVSGVASWRAGLWPQRLAATGVWAALGAAVFWVLRFNPTDRIADPTGPCTWHSLTGINGPTCGGTRMFWYLIHGNLVEAARNHLVALIGAPFALYALVQWTTKVWFGWRLPPPHLSKKVYIGYAAAWLVYSIVLRNLPWQPFAWFDIPNLT